tara:strand:+ start:4298 stop:4441 length:144 start_codon:yes stop_codon:yes gene_type:complete
MPVNKYKRTRRKMAMPSLYVGGQRMARVIEETTTDTKGCAQETIHNT